MHPGIIVFIVLYCVLLCTYFYTETSGKLYLRAPNKILLATMYFAFAIVMFALKKTPLPLGSAFAVILPALILVWIGDIVLLFNFTIGGIFFLAGNICFFVLQLLLLNMAPVPISQYWWIFLVIPVLVSIFIFLFLKFPNVFKLGKFKIPSIFYILLNVLHGITGLAVAIYLRSFLLLGLGSFLFMLSDFVIVIHRFVLPDNKWILRLNSGLYFVGLLLIVLNLAGI